LINPISVEELKILLYKGKTLPINQEKWYKSLSEGSIKISDEIYTLAVIENKRELIYNETNKLINTKPIIIYEK
jgi:hypothetical protein